jgi:hypothetical protein
MDTYEFTWSAEDFEDLLADLMAFQQDQIYNEYFQSPDFDVWAHLELWRESQCTQTCTCSTG